MPPILQVKETELCWLDARLIRKPQMLPGASAPAAAAGGTTLAAGEEKEEDEEREEVSADLKEKEAEAMAVDLVGEEDVVIGESEVVKHNKNLSLYLLFTKPN